MSTAPNSLTDISQLDELNKKVWATLESARRISQIVEKPELDGAFSSTQNTVIDSEAKTEASETPPPPPE